ncbi:MAG: CCA tRNA nucleotidyltransferase [Deltaproteobacteria bacterium]|nr:CCA tRNA nucleotidyltransferase [Deltaproteobacteria bacterium]
MDASDPVPVPKEISARVLRALRRRKPLWRFLAAFCRAVEQAGGKPYLAGGIVRDLAEGRPGKDIDLMVAGVGFEELGKLLRSLPSRPLGILRVLPVGKAFAVYKVRTAWAKEELDVALARAERSTGPGHREFRFRTRNVDAREDAGRRDFTINSLLFAFRADAVRVTGTVVDFHGGLADLRRKRIRGVGNAEDRFREDPLRMLRAIRQKNERTGYSIEKKTWAAIRRVAPALFRTIPAERVIDELLLSLSADPARTVDDLRRSGILPILLPEVRGLRKDALGKMKRRYAILERRLGHPMPENVLLANLLVDFAETEIRARLRIAARKRTGGGVPKPAGGREGLLLRLPRAEGIARRLHFPKVRSVVRMLEDLARLREIDRMRNRHARIEAIFARWETPEPLLALYEAASRAAGREEFDFLPVLREAARRPALLSGKRLIEIGIPAGPGMETVLETLRNATLTGIVGTAGEAERMALRIHRRKPAAGRRADHSPRRDRK